MAAPINPKGKKSEKGWRDAIMVSVNELYDVEDSPKKVKALRLISKKLVGMALDGDLGAIQEIGNRLDGRAPQTIKADVKHSVDAVSLDERALADDLLAALNAPTIEGETIVHRDITPDNVAIEAKPLKVKDP